MPDVDEQPRQIESDRLSLLARQRRGIFVRTALEQLPAVQRDVVVSVYFGGRSQSETAAALGLSPDAVRRRLFCGLRQLGTMINESLAAS
jgi:RNA polymerase sigma factor (sigma-70 family)